MNVYANFPVILNLKYWRCFKILQGAWRWILGGLLLGYRGMYVSGICYEYVLVEGVLAQKGNH